MNVLIHIAENKLSLGANSFRCAIGKSGFSSDKKEGDGCTPLGSFALRECWYRADRMGAPKTRLPLRVIRPEDGWCDDVGIPDYNQPILIPPPAGGRLGGGHNLEQAVTHMPPPRPSPCGGGSYEHLWRDDHVYDIIVPLGYNDDPVVAGKGSAIFLHVARPNYEPTEGCVALALPDLLEVLRHCDNHTRMVIDN